MVQSVRKRGPETLVLAVLLLAGQAQLGMAGTPTNTAQPPAGLAPAAIETLTYDHVHFGVPDPSKAVEWYAKYLGGQPGPGGRAERPPPFWQNPIYLPEDRQTSAQCRQRRRSHRSFRP